MRPFFAALLLTLLLPWSAQAQAIAPSVNPSKVILAVPNASGTAATPVKAGAGLPVADGGGSLTVDGSVAVSSLPAVTGTVTSTIQLAGPTAIVGGQGTAAAGVIRVVQAQPSGVTPSVGLVVADQTVGPELPDVPANPNRASLLLRIVGTGPCLVSEGEATGGGAKGVPLKGGTADDDGTGEWVVTTGTFAVWVWDPAGTGLCKFRWTEEVW